MEEEKKKKEREREDGIKITFMERIKKQTPKNACLPLSYRGPSICAIPSLLLLLLLVLLLLLDPVPPLPEPRVRECLLLALVPGDAEVELAPPGLAADPAGLAGEAEEGLVAGPPLLGGDVGEVGGAVAAAAVAEAEAHAVDADDPVARVGHLLEVGEEGDGDLEGGELAAADGAEARVLEGGYQGVLGEAYG